jgi:molybdopterin molybdotransferase
MVQEALAELGEMRFRQVTMHPGPAQGFGRLGRDDIPVICIPGEPVAALVAFEVFVRPAIRLMLGKRQLFRRTVQAIAGQPLASPLGYRQYLHGTVMRHPDGGYVVEPVGDGTEALLARMARANCLIVIDEDVTEVAAGGLVTVMPLLLGG